MNQRTAILAESIIDDLVANGREDIIAIAVLNLRLATEPGYWIKVAKASKLVNELQKNPAD